MLGEQRFWHHGERAAHAGEAAVLREAAELDGALARARNFVNRLRDRRIRDEGLVGGVEEDDRAVLERVIDPRLQFVAGGGGAGRIVRRAEIDQVERRRPGVGHVRHEAVGFRAGKVMNARVRAGRIGLAGIAGHDVGVDVDRIDGIGDAESIARAENVQDVPGVAFRSVRNKDLVVGHLQAARAEHVLQRWPRAGNRTPAPGRTL